MHSNPNASRSPNTIAVVLCGNELSTSEKNLFQLFDFFGIHSIKISANESNLYQAIAQHVGNAQYCLFSTVASFAMATRVLDWNTKNKVIASANSAFICDFNDTTESEEVLRYLTSVATAKIRRGIPAVLSVSICKDWPEFSGPMSGLEVPGVRAESVSAFAFPKECPAYQHSIVEAESGVYFVKTRVSDSPIFASSSGINIDIASPVDGSYFDVKNYFMSVVPVVMYLRWAFESRFWMNTHLSASCIVDDPLLKRRYGFLVFRNVFAQMQRHRFSTTIAFIPWNWRRTNTKTAELFRQNPDQFSLVVHGNDHTAGEFGARSVELLDQKVKAASRRMEAHERITRINWSPIMIFPQGVFSTESLAALKMNNFIAAVNTEVNPIGHYAPKTEISELWNIAIMKFSSFPVLTRRYMEHGVENFAFDLLLGKPCLVVAHHDVFRDDARRFLDFVAALNSLNCSLHWRSLAETIKRSFRVRENCDGTSSVQMFANEMLLEGKINQATTVHVTKRELHSASIRAVTANARPIDWAQDMDRIRFSVNIPSGGSIHLRVEYQSSSIDNPRAEGIGYQFNCGLRRIASELRDNYVCRNAFLSRCARVLRRGVK